MVRLCLVFSAVVAILILSLAPASAKAVSSTQLIENSRIYDGKVISYQGEVVGDIMIRGEYIWANVHDGTNALGIWMLKDKAKAIKFKGDYKHIGDTVEATGIFHRACAQHGGDMDIHAMSLQVVERGHVLEHVVKSGRVSLAVILSIVSGILLIYHRKLRQGRI